LDQPVQHTKRTPHIKANSKKVKQVLDRKLVVYAVKKQTKTADYQISGWEL